MDNGSPFFAVIIVNYNAGHYLQKNLDSLARQTFRNFEVILVDNASEDGSIDDLITKDLPKFKLVAETQNHGFAKGNNLAVGHTQAPWIALLNPDAVAEPDWLAQLASAIEAHPEVKVFASAQMNMEAPSLMDGAGDAYLGFGFPWRGGFERPARELPAEGLCFSPCGAGAIFETRTFLAHNGFDEDFFCYCEDVDLGFRMQSAGEPCLFLPKAVISHKGSAISGRHSAFSTYYGTRNRIWTYFKNMPTPLLLLTLPVHIILSAYLVVRHAMLGQLKASVRGHYHGFRDGMKLRKKAALTRKARAIPLGELMNTMCWNILRMHKRKPHVRSRNTAGQNAVGDLLPPIDNANGS